MDFENSLATWAVCLSLVDFSDSGEFNFRELTFASDSIMVSACIRKIKILMTLYFLKLLKNIQYRIFKIIKLIILTRLIALYKFCHFPK